MRRRDLLAVLGSSAGWWPLRAGGQTPTRLGFLGAGSANSVFEGRAYRGLIEGLSQNGLIEGRDYSIETRFAEGDYGRFLPLARELQQANVRIIIPGTVVAVRAVQQLSPPVIIVMPGINDPVGTGLIASLARPGGMTTGMATLNQDVTSKILEFIHYLIPGAITLAGLYNPGNPSTVNFLLGLRSECTARGISLMEFSFSPSDWRSNLSSLLTSSRRPDAMFLLADTAIYDQAEHIAALALEQRIPTFGTVQESAYAGALLAYGPSYATVARRSAYYIRRILEGANPADLPVEQPTRIGIAVNLKSARALGVNVPDELLATADDVIE
jgi:putative ABC transport system substrate-binding protein